MPVCITGMHRSGTSMVAHALSLCGLDLGPEDQMRPADGFNRGGYWENLRFVGISNWALDSLGGGWDMPPVVAPTAELRRHFVPAAQKAVAEIGFSEPWGWKDPRACLLAGLWQEAIADLRFVVVVRHPLDVVLSLRRRYGSSAQMALSLWGTYYSELLAQVSPSDRVVVAYDAFLADAAGSVDRLAGWLGLPADAARREEAVGAVDPGLRQYASDAESREGMSEEVASLYDALLAEAREGSTSPAKSLPPLSERVAAVAAGAVVSERDELRDQVAAAREDVKRLEIDRDAWRTEARHWRSETERLVAVEQQRLAFRVKRARHHYARRTWRALPAGVRNQLRPLIFRQERYEFIAPEPLNKDDSPPSRPPARPPAQWRSGRAGGSRQPIDVPVSVVVPTLNAGTDASLFLAALERQAGVPHLELLVADSGSTDGTRELFAAKADVMLDIPAGEFGHGRTRNEAFAASSGEVVVMTVQDALLLGPHALHDLVQELLSDDGLAAVSARQVARSDADLFGAYNVVSHYNALWRDGRSAKPADPLYRRAAAGVDDVCAAIRRSAWDGLQYRDVEFGEDLDFGMRALAAGWRVGLSDDVAVAHSHTRDAQYQFRRSVADRLNIAPLVGETSVARSASAGTVPELAAAGVALLGDVAAALALSGETEERLSLLLTRVYERVETPLASIEPSRGQLASLAELLTEIANGADANAAIAPLRWEFAGHLGRPLLTEFAEAQRAPSPEAAADFVAKLAATVVGCAVGDRLRVDDSSADRERLLVGV